MAKVIGEAGKYVTSRSVAALQRMLFTTVSLLVAIALFEGAMASAAVATRGHLNPIILGLGLTGLPMLAALCRYQWFRIDQYERDRMNWRRGAFGERLIDGILAEKLPDSYYVINNVETVTGDIDHVVIGPTGVFAIDTKNWRGCITAACDGELLLNGNRSSKPEVGNLLRRTMLVREKIIRATQSSIYLQPLMVFPKARVEASFGSTRKVHCLTDEKLASYIQNSAFSQELSRSQVEQVRQSVERISNSDRHPFDEQRRRRLIAAPAH